MVRLERRQGLLDASHAPVCLGELHQRTPEPEHRARLLERRVALEDLPAPALVAVGHGERPPQLDASLRLVVRESVLAGGPDHLPGNLHGPGQVSPTLGHARDEREGGDVAEGVSAQSRHLERLFGPGHGLTRVAQEPQGICQI